MDLVSNWKATRVSNAVVAGTTDVNSSSVDMSGFESVIFIVSFGAITATAVTSIKAGQSADDVTFNDLKDSGITVADSDDNQIVLLEIVRPIDRHVRCTVDRGTANAVIDGIVALQGRALEAAVTHDVASVVGSELHHAPAEGTA